MQTLQDLLRVRLRTAGIEPQVEASLVVSEAKKKLEMIFGKGILNKVQPLYVKEKVLTIAVLSSVVAQEIRFREKDIVETVNKKTTQKVVERIGFVM